MIDPQGKVSIRRQCELLDMPRSTFYFEPLGISANDLKLCAELDRLHLEFPAAGSRVLSRHLRARGQRVNRKRVQRLMREMGLESLAPKPRTTIASREHEKFPYLLRNLEIVRPNQVWAADVTYISTVCNTDQGSQFTDKSFMSVLLNAGVKISMDGRVGAYIDKYNKTNARHRAFGYQTPASIYEGEICKPEPLHAA